MPSSLLESSESSLALRLSATRSTHVEDLAHEDGAVGNVEAVVGAAVGTAFGTAFGTAIEVEVVGAATNVASPLP